MDRESNRPRGRSGRDAQHLRDIAHLYLSGSRKPMAPSRPVSRRFCLGVTAAFNSLAKVDLCANMALQFARLGRRTLVLDLDASLPNVGFRMGLPPVLYLNHLLEDAEARVERGPLGVRVLVGVASRSGALRGEALQELQQADCVLVNLPAAVEGLRSWRSLLGQTAASEAVVPAKPARDNRPGPAAHLESAPGDKPPVVRSSTASQPNRRTYPTTMARAGARSRMFGQWLETAQRRGSSQPEIAATNQSEFDALIYVQDAVGPLSTSAAILAWQSACPTARLHLVQCSPAGADAEAIGRLRAPEAHPDRDHLQRVRLPAAPIGAALHHPSSLLYPEHESSQLYENLAQSLLASGRRGGGDVRAR